MQPKATSSPIVIDLHSASDKSSRSARSSKSGHTTRNSSKRKADEVPEAKKPKKAKKEEKKKKNAHDKGKQNGSQPAKLKEETLNDFLKKKDLKKWHYIIDMVSPEDIEAIDILITQRQNEVEASLDKEIKEELEGEKPVLKDGKQTDGSCDRTIGSGTDVTDATDIKKGKQHKKQIHRKWNKEFIVYVGEERTKMCLVECSNSNSLCETSESDFQILGSALNSNLEESASNSNSEDSDKSGKNSNLEESDKSGSNSNSEGSDKSGSNSNSDRSGKSAKNSNSEETAKESEVSVEEIEVPPKSIPIYDVDSSSNSKKTEDIYKSYMDGSKISLATVSTVSPEPYTQADKSVEVLAKTPVTEQSTTIPYS